MVMHRIRVLLFCALSTFLVSSCADNQVPLEPLKFASYPLELSKDCRDGRAKIYDQCSDQMVLLNAALEQAAAEDKLVLVSYGAEWCIWCHVFDLHLAGYFGEFEYTYGEPGDAQAATSKLYERSESDVRGQAIALNHFIAQNFVVAHIDYEFAPNSSEVLYQTEAYHHIGNWVPFIFVLDRDGKYVGEVVHDDVEVRRDFFIDWYRGYDRPKLIAVLKGLQDQALQSSD